MNSEDTPPFGTASAAPVQRPRRTRQQRVIREILDQGNDFRTAQQLHAQLTANGEQASLATVYRVLQNFARNGEVDTWRNPAGEVAYRHCSPRHHHHLICRQCGRTVEIAGGPAEEWALRVATEHGFTQAEHHVEIYGLCPLCTSRGKE
ncbi:Fur family transcriptional regulator, ferric uptake regulator [Propionibacterium cyclohexanicum]|uniref:Fur family transcriptional regulator, ferric uptake regulator n=1 Tax=Propionibacterium cyclohexanicum TaxID=64702 RepID=A0A1H9Q665_9ACTN|nr:Fur family transcriptional regulator [Propionibacterium cyclohexanicum]SER55937.1 Fur family transcriptional regulator, ferric uptake regulator [Propionibacterium cyclohexanicum]